MEPGQDSGAQLAALRRCLGGAAPALLSSAARGPLGRFDLLPLAPDAPLVVPYPGHPQHLECLTALQSRLQGMRAGSDEPPAGEWPFASGWLLYLAYDFAQVFEPSVAPGVPRLDEPLALLWRVPAVVMWDQAQQRLHLGGDAASARAWLARCQPVADRIQPCAVDWSVQEDDPTAFLAGVERIHEYLRSGDVFQVNLSRAWTASSATDIDLDALYAQLCRSNPAPFAALLQHGRWGLASSSPERLVSVRGRRVDTRPIAGTRRRDGDATKDAALLAELRRDPKERAEHIMLIDLERNDLGRICEPGSVVVDELGAVESYTHVHHLVSNVSGRLRPDVDVWSLLRAVFPGGTITGCPKVRCMQIIHELEGEGRGAYTGTLGYIGDDGTLDFNILIRTLSVFAEKLVFRAGAGIVADSIATRELLETRAKAKGLLRALGLPG